MGEESFLSFIQTSTLIDETKMGRKVKLMKLIMLNKISG